MYAKDKRPDCASDRYPDVSRDPTALHAQPDASGHAGNAATLAALRLPAESPPRCPTLDAASGMDAFYATGAYTPTARAKERTTPPAPSGDLGVKPGAPLANHAVSYEHEADGYTAGDAGVAAKAGLALHDNGLAATGSGKATADADNDEGLTAKAGLEVGAGLSAFADVRDLPGGGAVIAVTLTASARLGGTAGYAQGDQGGSQVAHGGVLGASGSLSGTWDTVEIVDGPKAAAFKAAWRGGDGVPALRSLASAAAILDRVARGDAARPTADGLQEGARRRSRTAVEGALCLSASWAQLGVRAKAGDKGIAERSIEATPDGLLRVGVSFTGEVTLQASGSVNLGLLTLTKGEERRVEAGLSSTFSFDGATERALADAVLAAPDRTALEALADTTGHVQATVLDAEASKRTHGMERAGVAAGWTDADERRDAIATGADGMGGTRVSGSSTHGFAVSAGGKPVVGVEDRAALALRVEGDQATATFERAETSHGLGLGLPSSERVLARDWPSALAETFTRSRKALEKVSLDDDEVRQILFDRVHDEAAWAQCARTVATHHKWIATGAAIRGAVPEPAWVAADEGMAHLVARMRHLADFVATTPESAHVLENLTERFGNLKDVNLDYQRIGTLETWPAGTEALQQTYAALTPRLERLDADLAVHAARGDTGAGLALVDALRDALHALQNAVGRADVDDTDKQMRVVEDLAKVRVDLEWQRELFARSSGACDANGAASAFDAGDGFVEDARQREAWVLWTTMADYQRVEAGLFAKYRGAGGFDAMREFMEQLKRLYARWMAASIKARQSGAAMREPTPEWDRAAEVYESMGAWTVNAKPLDKVLVTIRAHWSE